MIFLVSPLVFKDDLFKDVEDLTSLARRGQDFRRKCRLHITHYGYVWNPKDKKTEGVEMSERPALLWMNFNQAKDAQGAFRLISEPVRKAIIMGLDPVSLPNGTHGLIGTRVWWPVPNVDIPSRRAEELRTRTTWSENL